MNSIKVYITMLKYNNIQKIINNTTQDISFTLKVDGKESKTHDIRAAETKKISATRNGFGHVGAKVTISYENGREYEFKFSVTAKDRTDTVEVYDSKVIYNGVARGNFIPESALTPIDATMKPLIDFVNTDDPALKSMRVMVSKKFPEFTKEYIDQLTRVDLIEFLK